MSKKPNLFDQLRNQLQKKGINLDETKDINTDSVPEIMKALYQSFDAPESRPWPPTSHSRHTSHSSHTNHNLSGFSDEEKDQENQPASNIPRP